LRQCRLLFGVVEQPVTTTALAEALRRDAAALLEAYRAGTWTPEPEEHELAEGLAHGRWDGPFFRAVLRDVASAIRSYCGAFRSMPRWRVVRPAPRVCGDQRAV
jgi:hypothetical protein